MARAFAGSFALAAALLFLSPSCAHQHQRRAGVGELKAAAERFHGLVRWGDWRSALQLVAPELRARALKASLDRKDEEDLKVIDFELQDAQVDGEKATVLSKITWHRLPSVTARTDAVVFDYVERSGAWYIRGIEGGPIPLPKEPGTRPGPFADP